MYEVIGHEKVRAELAEWNHPFVIVGPEGVGRKGIRLEKFDSLPDTSDPHRLLKFVTQYDSAISTEPIPGIRNFFVGKLTDQNVSDILKRDYPKVMSRALVTSMLNGSFMRMNETTQLVEAFEQVTSLLDTHAVPHNVSRYLMEVTTQACLFRITGTGWAFNDSLIRSTIPMFLAVWYLKAEPTEGSTIQFYYGVRDGFVD